MVAPRLLSFLEAMYLDTSLHERLTQKKD